MQKEPSLHLLRQDANSLVYRITKIVENNVDIALIAGVLWNVWNLPQLISTKKRKSSSGAIDWIWRKLELINWYERRKVGKLF